MGIMKILGIILLFIVSWIISGVGVGSYCINKVTGLGGIACIPYGIVGGFVVGIILTIIIAVMTRSKTKE